MTTILAVETAGNDCSVALAIEGTIVQQVEATPRAHAKKILPMVDSLLARAGVGLADLDAIAYTKGPGSFTGLRIGFGVVQGLAFGARVPVIGVSTLEVMAQRAVLALGITEGLVAAALDARMNEVYLGVYAIGERGLLRPQVADCALTPEAAGRLLPAALEAAVGEGWPLIPWGGSCNQQQPQLAADAATLADVARHYFARGDAVDIHLAQLAYIRNEVSWKKWERIRAGNPAGQEAP